MNELPSGLQKLSLGDFFDQSLERVKLPATLQSLSFGSDFNRSLRGVHLPRSLKSLNFGIHFNQAIEDVELPNSLEELSFGWDFKQNLALVKWPSSLRRLSFAQASNLEQLRSLPSLQSLTLKVRERSQGGFRVNHGTFRVSVESAQEGAQKGRAAA